MNTARPSTIGEILDRAIATYVRRFVPLFIILALFLVPIAIGESLVGPGLAHVMDMIAQLGRVPPGHAAESARILRAFQATSGATGPVAGMYLAQLVFIPLADTALIVFAATVLDERPASIGSAYRIALARWLPQLGVAAAFLGMLVAAAGVAGVGLVLVALAIAGIYAFSHAVAIVLGIVVTLTALAASVVAAAIANVAWLMATVSIAVEEPNPARAIVRSLRRTFDRSLLKRTIGLGCAILAISLFGTLAFVSFSAVVGFATHSELLAALASSAGGIVISGVCTVMVLVYVRDLKLRREGVDLLLLAGGEPAPHM